MNSRNECHAGPEPAAGAVAPALRRLGGLALTPFDAPWTVWAFAIPGRSPRPDERDLDESR